MMINIGLTAWSDRDTLYPELANKKINYIHMAVIFRL